MLLARAAGSKAAHRSRRRDSRRRPSGLYAAYRLLTGSTGSRGHRRPRVAVFEAADRLGGRIWSVVPPGAPHLIAEFGGMRYLENQAIVPRLISALKLPSVPFSRGNGQNLYYLRGRRFTASQFTDPRGGSVCPPPRRARH